MLPHTLARSTAALVSVAALAAGSAAALAGGKSDPLVIEEQGSFLVGGTIITAPGTHDPFNPTPPDGQTFRGDHAYVQYQIPVKPRELPIVMWHGGGQMAKTWETTPDGREGFQNVFLRRNFSVYNLDQPRRGRAGRSTVNGTISATPNEQAIFSVFRLGVWPNFYPGVQFSRDPDALDQYFRQQTPNTGPGDNNVASDAVAALFDKIGPAILLTHSASGPPGWQTGVKAGNVKGLISYEPVAFMFPQGEAPPALPTAYDGTLQSPGEEVPLADFLKLTKFPIQVVFGDFIPNDPTLIPGVERWRLRLIYAQQFVDKINEHGGDAELLHLPKIGVYGNTHFPFSDLNSLKIADLLSKFLHRKGLDDYPRKHHGPKHGHNKHAHR